MNAWRFVAPVSLSLMVACGGGAVGPSESQPAAFEMTIVGETPCPEGVAATLCLRVRITNRGDQAGDGSCRLRGHVTTEAGHDRAVFGPGITLTDFAGRTHIEKVLPWRKERPEGGFSGYCEPGFRS